MAGATVLSPGHKLAALVHGYERFAAAYEPVVRQRARRAYTRGFMVGFMSATALFALSLVGGALAAMGLLG